MRVTDWAGSPPADAKQAEQMLLQGALACAKRHGVAKVNIKRVAEQVGVTRQTVYRYFPSSQALVDAVSWHLVSGVMKKLDKHLASVSGFEDKVIESVIFLTEKIPNDPYLKQYFTTSGFDRQNLAELFADSTLNYCYEYLKSLYGTNTFTKKEEKWLRELAEHLLRTVLSLIVTPSPVTETKQGKREYLGLWLKPLLQF